MQIMHPQFVMQAFCTGCDDPDDITITLLLLYYTYSDDVIHYFNIIMVIFRLPPDPQRTLYDGCWSTPLTLYLPSR